MLHQVDDTLHEITAHVDLTKPMDADSYAKEKHEKDGHLRKDSECPACIRKSGSRVLHHKGYEPHFMDIGNMNIPDYHGYVYYLATCLKVRLENDTPALLP
eukprot:4171380-Amphidinium_carterae.1